MFECQMCSCCQAHQQWEILRLDPETERDERGPAGNRLRLQIPSNLLGKDYVEERRVNFKEQSKISKSPSAACNF